MKQSLYANTRRMTRTFCIVLAALTLLILVLRLTVFRDMTAAPETDMETTSSDLLTYSINRQIYFSSPDAKGNILLENPATNNCYMSVDIIRPEDKKSLLYTGLLAPGKTIGSMALSEGSDLSVGVYECMAVVTAYDLDKREPLGKEEREVTLLVGVKPDKRD